MLKLAFIVTSSYTVCLDIYTCLVFSESNLVNLFVCEIFVELKTLNLACRKLRYQIRTVFPRSLTWYNYHLMAIIIIFHLEADIAKREAEIRFCRSSKQGEDTSSWGASCGRRRTVMNYRMLHWEYSIVDGP